MVFGWPRPVEKQQVGRNAGVGCEYAVGQPDDGVEVELFEQPFFDAGADAIAKESSVGHNDGSTPRFAVVFFRPFEQAHVELEKQKRRFRGLKIIGKIRFDTSLFLTSERGIGENDIHSVFVPDFLNFDIQRVVIGNMRVFQIREAAGSFGIACKVAA